MRYGIRRLLLLWLIVAVAAFVLCTGALAAGPRATVNYGYGQFAPGNRGGEFDITTIGWAVQPYGIAPRNPSHTFSTFCVQQNQYFVPGSTYDVQFAMSTNHTQNINLNAEVAKLYHMWNVGALGGYDYTTGVGRGEAGRDLQQVLWKLMHEQAVSQGIFPPDAPLTNARQWAWYWLVKGNTDWTGLQYVRVMRLYGPQGAGTYGDDHQDMLVELTPEPGSLALLAIGGVPLLPILRRRRAA